jgi:hypothetical protein
MADLPGQQCQSPIFAFPAPFAPGNRVPHPAPWAWLLRGFGTFVSGLPGSCGRGDGPPGGRGLGPSWPQRRAGRVKLAVITQFAVQRRPVRVVTPGVVTVGIAQDPSYCCCTGVSCPARPVARSPGQHLVRGRVRGIPAITLTDSGMWPG